MLDVAPVAGAEIVQDKDLVAPGGEQLDEMGADEPGSASDEVPHAEQARCCDECVCISITVGSIAKSTRERRACSAKSSESCLSSVPRRLPPAARCPGHDSGSSGSRLRIAKANLPNDQRPAPPWDGPLKARLAAAIRRRAGAPRGSSSVGRS